MIEIVGGSGDSRSGTLTDGVESFSKRNGLRVLSSTPTSSHDRYTLGMKAAVFQQYQTPLEILSVAEPECPLDGVLIRVAACGICRSDWHGWMGHDSDVALPHVPGHELAGTIAAVGSDVVKWKAGERVTVPFCCGCGTCRECAAGNTHICDNYTQPGFTQWGAFAEYVMIRHADTNLVGLPPAIDFVTAASLGCRFATAFRAIIDQAKLLPGESLAVHGCGGVGLSAVMIAAELGAKVIAVDVDTGRLEAAQQLGAEVLVNASLDDPVKAVVASTAGGADVSLDALGHRETCCNSISCLRKQGRHVQVGLLLGPDSDPSIPMSSVIGKELQLIGSHGMQASAYSRMLHMIEQGSLSPQRLIHDRVSLEEGARLLTKMDRFPGTGVTVIELT
jgi:alcohol dehydrogenase